MIRSFTSTKNPTSIPDTPATTPVRFGRIVVRTHWNVVDTDSSYLLLAMVVPQVYDSVVGLIQAIPDYIEVVQLWLQTFFEDNPDIQASVMSIYSSAVPHSGEVRQNRGPHPLECGRHRLQIGQDIGVQPLLQRGGGRAVDGHHRGLNVRIILKKGLESPSLVPL